MHLVKLHFWSLDKDRGHTIWSDSRSWKPLATSRLHCSMFYGTGSIADGSFTVRE